MDIKLNKQTKTVPLSDIPEPDMLSANRRSLSGSVSRRDMLFLFFNIDLERRLCSRFGELSIESIEEECILSTLAKYRVNKVRSNKGRDSIRLN